MIGPIARTVIGLGLASMAKVNSNLVPFPY